MVFAWSFHGSKKASAPDCGIVGAIAEGFRYVAAPTPAFVATMRSGLSAAIWSTWMPLARLSTVGCAVPSLGWAHGHTANGSLPNHSVVALGTTPTPCN